jgi:hypothetical protein
MHNLPQTIAYRTVGEWAFGSGHAYENPFTDVTVDATFASPRGKTFTVPAFYDGDKVWRIRFNPDEVGPWTYRVASHPANADLTAEGAFEVMPAQARGFLQATPGRAWGFHYESDEPVFLLGDTTYNLFGMAHCGGDVGAFLKRRAEQGFSLLRVRVPVSPFHPPEGYSDWQTRRTWPWGGSEQAPRFDRFNLGYFATVDQVVRQAETLGLGLEMIMEAWGFEFPFNSRHIFVPEWEELWLRYLIARYDAFNCVYFWTPMNEYEYYPDGNWHYNPVADRWAMRIGRWIKHMAQHGHIVSVHNGPQEPPFARRFSADPEAIDAVMFQTWGTRDAERGWLAAGIEEAIARSLDGWWGSAVLAEYGYERHPGLPLVFPPHEYCDTEHSRRGAWRGAFCALGVIHGFENSWGPFMILDQDQPGLVYLLHLRHFFAEVLPFHELHPAPQIILPGEHPSGSRPLALATASRDVVAVYLPLGGSVKLLLPEDKRYDAQWYDPRTGEFRPATMPAKNETGFAAPLGQSEKGHPWDWVLLLSVPSH